MTQIETIIAGIERRMKNNHQDATESGAGAFYEDKELLSFIHSLPAEQPSEGLEKAADCYLESIQPVGFMEGDYDGSQILDAFRAGANWQKEQMMKSAVRGGYIKRNRYTKVNVLHGFSNVCDAIQQFKDNDKVSIIIIKEDEQ